MDFNSIINDVNSKEDFMNFLTQLRLDKQQKSEEWENDEYVRGLMIWRDISIICILRCRQILTGGLLRLCFMWAKFTSSYLNLIKCQ